MQKLFCLDFMVNGAIQFNLFFYRTPNSETDHILQLQQSLQLTGDFNVPRTMALEFLTVHHHIVTN